MNFFELQEECIHSRFDHHKRDSIKMWINSRYAQVNGMTQWPWKYPSQRSLAWPDATEAVALDSTDGRIIGVNVSTSDSPLLFAPYDEFNSLFLSDVQTGEPTHWTIRSTGAGRELMIAPPPGDTTLTVIHSSSPMMLSDDNDEPVWPEDYHFALVLGAISTGLKIENDPTWEPLELEFNTMIAAMKDDLLPANEPGTRQYGRDMLGYELEQRWP